MDKSKRVLPPVYFLAALVSMGALHFFLPIAPMFDPPYPYCGSLLFITGVVLVLWGARSFSRAGTTIKPFQDPSALVTGGPYRYSRNPIYLGLVLALIGAGLLLGTLSPFVVVPVFIWLIQQRFIQPEEAALEKTFGSAYGQYKRQVRRWL